MSSELVAAYKNVNDIPSSSSSSPLIQIDEKNEAILLPIYGSLVPFHVSTVSNVTTRQHKSVCLFRIIFNAPANADGSTAYLNQVLFRSRDPKHCSKLVQIIKALCKKFQLRQSASVIIQEKIQIAAGSKFKPVRLSGLWISPAFSGRGRKSTGSLETHVNGFRYSTPKPEERVELMYDNVKHAFFQPAVKEMITLLHFHLHNPIMVGNKKTRDVQFYVKVIDDFALGGSSRRYVNDPDEIYEERREKERRNRIGLEFKDFVNKVNLEFEQPSRKLGFPGVPDKQTVFISPTANCLVALVETPYLVVTLSEIEIVNFERVRFGQSCFDMAIVFKDYERDVIRIDSIPSSSLNNIKSWLDRVDIKYYESRVNMYWKNVMKKCRDDPESFVEGGGWEFLNVDATDSDSDNSQQSDEGYEPSDATSEDDSEDSEEDSEEVESDSEEDGDSHSEEAGQRRKMNDPRGEQGPSKKAKFM